MFHNSLGRWTAVFLLISVLALVWVAASPSEDAQPRQPVSPVAYPKEGTSDQTREEPPAQLPDVTEEKSEEEAPVSQPAYDFSRPAPESPAVDNSYFAARRFIVDEMLRYEHCYPYVIGLVLRSTKRIANVSVHHRAREEGRSGYTISKLLNLWMNGFTSFSVKPLRLATYAGTVFAGFGFLYLIYIIIEEEFLE